MIVKASTGLRNYVLATGPMRDALDGFVMKLYGGTMPADADAAATGTLLATISVNNTGTGLTFAATAANGVLSKDNTEVWSGLVSVSGTCTHYRLVDTTDSGSASTTEIRVQGDAGEIGYSLNISDPSLTASAIQNIDYFVVALPAG